MSLIIFIFAWLFVAYCIAGLLLEGIFARWTLTMTDREATLSYFLILSLVYYPVVYLLILVSEN